MKPTLKSLDNYRIELSKVSESDGGGWFASYPELGSKLFLGWGQSETEAIAVLRELAEDLIKDYARRKIELPEPQCDEEFSGRFVVRLPRAVHARLVRDAKRERVSLNTLVVSQLSDPTATRRYQQMLESLSSETRRQGMTLQAALGNQTLRWAAHQSGAPKAAYFVDDALNNVFKKEVPSGQREY